MRFLFSLLTALICYPLSATTVFNTNCRAAFAQILALKPVNACRYLSLEKSINPTNLYIPYLENYLDFLQISINEDPKVIRQYNENFNNRILEIKSTKEVTPYRDYLLSQSYLQFSFIKAKLNERFAAARYFFKAQSDITANIKKYPFFKPNLKVCGILDLISNSLPPVYRYLLPSPASRHDGFADLTEYNSTVSGDSILSLESTILISLTLLQFDNHPEHALTFIKNNEYPGNPLFRLAKILILTRTGKSLEAMKILENAPKDPSEIHIVFLDYLQGEISLNASLKGSEQLELFLKNYRGQNYIKTAWLKLGWYYYLSGNMKKYEICRQNIHSKGEAWVEADKQSLWENAQNAYPNTYLLKSRLMFDGGLYENARGVLQTNQCLTSLANDGQRLEYFYRLGRIHHALNDFPKAILFYKYALNQGKDNAGYFAANAALQLGMISLISGNKKEAASYFKQCLEIKQVGYSSTIHAKASSALRQCLN